MYNTTYSCINSECWMCLILQFGRRFNFSFLLWSLVYFDELGNLKKKKKNVWSIFYVADVCTDIMYVTMYWYNSNIALVIGIIVGRYVHINYSTLILVGKVEETIKLNDTWHLHQRLPPPFPYQITCISLSVPLPLPLSLSFWVSFCPYLLSRFSFLYTPL